MFVSSKLVTMSLPKLIVLICCFLEFIYLVCFRMKKLIFWEKNCPQSDITLQKSLQPKKSLTAQLLYIKY